MIYFYLLIKILKVFEVLKGNIKIKKLHICQIKLIKIFSNLKKL
jgi:hypothetical protein